MFAKKNGPPRRRASIIAAVPLIALCTAGAGAYVAFADETTPVVVTSSRVQAPADLEQAFWACDFVGTTYGVDAAPVAFCSEVTAALQEQKFDGDFGRLLEWWKQNKPTQHARLESVEVANASMR
ncbi:MAG: hypothetical protein ACXWCY_31710 [Burkholderiales bacterium]